MASNAKETTIETKIPPFCAMITFENECDKLYLHKYISITWHLTTKCNSADSFYSFIRMFVHFFFSSRSV